MRRTPWELLRIVLRRAAPDGGADPPPDAELLDRIVRTRDEAAFELLLWRHAGLVLGVCRRTVPDDHLAEDAFQATFLILARKAGSVRRAGSVAGWLHRVARRVATRAARNHALRVGREAALTSDPTAATSPESGGELRIVLDQEIDRLPERFRLPVVLCYLQGRTTEDAGRLLGVPRGTVLSRLAAARKSLAARLTRRGVTVPAGLVAVSLGVPAVGHALIATALRPAAAFAGGGPAAALASPLATEVLRMTAWKQTAGLAVALVLTAGLGTGIGVVASAQQQDGSSPAAGAAPADPPKPAAPAVPADPAQERRDRLQRQVERIEKQEHLTHSRIGELTIQQQKRRQTAADDVDVQALRTQLGQLDDNILLAEDAIGREESIRQRVLKMLGQFETLRPNIAEMEKTAAADPRVRDAAATVSQKQRVVTTIAGGSEKTSQLLKKAEEELAAAEAKLATVRTAARADAEKQWATDTRAALKTDYEAAIVGVDDAKRRLEVLRKKRSEFVRRIAEARAAEDANLLLEDELRIYREFRQQLIRQRLHLQLELDGVTLSGGGAGSSGDARVEQLVREVQDLKAEVKRLSEVRK